MERKTCQINKNILLNLFNKILKINITIRIKLSTAGADEIDTTLRMPETGRPLRVNFREFQKNYLRRNMESNSDASWNPPGRVRYCWKPHKQGIREGDRAGQRQRKLKTGQDAKNRRKHIVLGRFFPVFRVFYAPCSSFSYRL